MPDHLHIMMTLPTNDANYSLRWALIKSTFSRKILESELISSSRKNKRERSIWQRRYWEHLIRNEKDYEHHLNYIHYNPVKHGYVKKAVDWPFSSIHWYIAQAILTPDWSCETDYSKSKLGE